MRKRGREEAKEVTARKRARKRHKLPGIANADAKV